MPEPSPAAARLLEAGYTAFAAAYVRGALGAVPAETDAATLDRGLAAGLRLHRFKRNAELPRVRRVLGVLRGLGPASLLDVGSGRGTFLWPLLDALPGVPTLSIERSPDRATQLGHVATGGVTALSVVRGDARRLPLASGAVDTALALEVLEHLHEPTAAAVELVRVARRFVVATVPSTPDDNPEHVQLFAPKDLERLFGDAGATKVDITGVHGHHVVVARVD